MNKETKVYIPSTQEMYEEIESLRHELSELRDIVHNSINTELKDIVHNSLNKIKKCECDAKRKG